MLVQHRGNVILVFERCCSISLFSELKRNTLNARCSKPSLPFVKSWPRMRQMCQTVNNPVSTQQERDMHQRRSEQKPERTSEQNDVQTRLLALPVILSVGSTRMHSSAISCCCNSSPATFAIAVLFTQEIAIAAASAAASNLQSPMALKPGSNCG